MGGTSGRRSYRFVKNVYDVRVPSHLERIRAAVDQLPSPSVDHNLFDAPQDSGSGSPAPVP